MSASEIVFLLSSTDVVELRFILGEGSSPGAVVLEPLVAQCRVQSVKRSIRRQLLLMLVSSRAFLETVDFS